ncbi:hypothetical protein b3_0002 [Synechococcus phage B3]|nr:hypothetical protein b3_0002 [Synechococcus phage B3]QGT54630.1 hypothetical protein b23_0002 [Synechococcus phage B23]
MAHYFRSVPNFNYVSRLPNAKINDYIQIKNFFRKGKIFEEIFNELSFFEKYNIEGDEKPYNVAQKIYGDSTLDWVIFLSNNYLSVQDEWPLSQDSFDKVMIQKYGSYEALYQGIHHYETIEVKDSRGRILLPEGTQVNSTWKTNGNFIKLVGESESAYSYEYYDSDLEVTVSVPSTELIKVVTNYDYEINKEERKREIFLLKAQYLNILFENLEDIMTYKEGGTQYVDRKLKRGENTKIFNQ